MGETKSRAKAKKSGTDKVLAEAVSFPLRVAAIDVGSTAMRFFAAEFSAPDRFQPLTAERAAIRLGHDVFLAGAMQPEAMDAAVDALRDFRARMEGLGVSRYRALATSAVREARNGEAFVARVRRETGLALETITGTEEARLFYLAVKNRIALGHEGMLLVDLGGGSVEISLVDDTGIQWIESHTMGSVRLLEELAGAGGEPGRFSRLLHDYVASLRIPRLTEGRPIAGFIATGGNIEALARLADAEQRLDGVTVLRLSKLRQTIDRLSRLSYHQRVTQLGLREDRADIILPAAMLYERLATMAKIEEILVPFISIKEGIVLDLVDDLATHRAHADRQQQLTFEGAIALGRRYLFDEKHARHVAELALALFDQLPKLHGLSEAERRVLSAAAVLHDIGAFVSSKRHHKHSWYLISASELPGFTPREIEMVANVARYHRKGDPAPHHEPFMRLVPLDRERVTKLSALLRLAEALDRDHLQRVQRLRVRAGKQGEIKLDLEGEGDLLLERWAVLRKSSLFAKCFGRKLRLVGS